MGQSRLRSTPGVIFGVIIAILALGNFSVGLYPYGTAVWVRPLFSLLGITSAVCLFAGIAWWRVLIPVWSILQGWIIATDISGEWFFQGLIWGAKTSHSVKMNNLLVEYKASGFNAAALVLLVILAIIAGLRLHPPIRATPRRVRRLAVAFVWVLCAVGVAVLFSRSHSHAPNTISLDLDVPRVPIYYKDQLLGHTPLTINSDAVRKWKLPLSAFDKLRLYSWGWADAVVLSDGTTHLPLYAGAPFPFAGYLDTFQTPWGQRCRMNVGSESRDGREQSGYLYRRPELRAEPILAVSILNAQPQRPGDALKVHCVLHNPTSIDYVGRKAVIKPYWFSHVDRTPSSATRPFVRREVEQPESWDHLPPGATMTADLEFIGPRNPDSYEFFCTWFLYAPTPDSYTGVGSVYSNILNLQVVAEESAISSTKAAD